MKLKQFMDFVWSHINVLRLLIAIGYIIFSLLNIFCPRDVVFMFSFACEYLKDV